MLLSSRRVALVYFCLAGMEIAWFTPFLLLAYHGRIDGSPWAVYLGLLAALLVWMLALDLLSRRQLAFPAFELAALALILFSSLVLVRLLLYADRPPADLTWLAPAWGALSDFSRGLRPEAALILVNFFLWQRAASATSRELSFFSVGLSFRLGMLLLILSAGLYAQFTGARATLFLWLYFSLGLTAVAVARIHEGAISVRSAGAPLSESRLVQLLLAVAVTVGLAALASFAYTAGNIGVFVSWLQPLWNVLGWLLLRFLQVVFWLLVPFMLWLEARLRGLDLSGLRGALQGLTQALPAEQQEAAAHPGLQVAPWVWIVLRDLGILLVVALLLGLIWLYLERVRRSGSQDEAESESGEDVTLGGRAIRRRLRRLRDLALLVRHFGLGRRLLAAISVQNIYANLCRLARRRGYPRRPAQPPDDYLPVLAHAFPGSEPELARITAAYQRVHYGDLTLATEELMQVRRDYDRVRDQAVSGTSKE